MILNDLYQNECFYINCNCATYFKNLIYPNEENDYKEKILYLPRIWNALSVPDNLVPITDEKIYNNK